MENTIFIDVTLLEPRQKHPRIFEAFDAIAHGNVVVIHNDHDPKPLYYQLLGERGNCFSWHYRHSGPEIWEVEIRKNTQNPETVGEIAGKDMRKAELFKKLGIDFCCGGKKSLEDACLEKGLDVIRIKEELEQTGQQPDTGRQLDFNSWSLSFLADFIVNAHHSYVKQNAPVIEELAQKVAAHHKDKFPLLTEVYNRFHELRCELLTHMKKEESVVFPYIRQMEQDKAAITGLRSVKEPIIMMEHDHEIAGDLVKTIRTLTNNFTLPAEACNSFTLLYKKLEEFETDLLQHIHLENNILFPKAIAME